MIDLQKNEKWIAVPDYEEYYEISNIGRVRSLDRTKLNSIGSLRVTKGILLKPTKASTGYYTVMFSVGGKTKRILVHRIVATAFIPNPENKPQVNHINGIKTDNRLENLEWCTRKENIAHADINGLMNRATGESVGISKLTKNNVLAIRRLYSIKGFTDMDLITKKYNVSKSTVNNVISRKTWKHV